MLSDDELFKEASKKFDLETIYKLIGKGRSLPSATKRNIRAILLGHTPGEASSIIGIGSNSLKPVFSQLYRDIERITGCTSKISSRNAARICEQAGYGALPENTFSEDLTSARIIQEYLHQEILTKANSVASAPCCCFLSGDWSVLITKKAILAPIDMRVQVSLCKNELGKNEVFAYEKNGKIWIKNDCYSNKFSDVYNNSINIAANIPHFSGFFSTSITAYVFSEAPYGAGLHEDAAFCLALSASLLMLSEVNLSSQLKEFLPLILKFSGHVLKFWYSQVSWVTLLCSALSSENKKKVMFCDRSNDFGINFGAIILEEDKNEIIKNLELNPLEFDIEWISFDFTKIAMFIHEPTTVDIDETTTRYKEAFLNLKKWTIEPLSSEMKIALAQGNYEKIGTLMDLHQIYLNLCGFSANSYENRLRKLRGIDSIFGAKASCSRGKGAIILLHQIKQEQVFFGEEFSENAQVLLPINKPTNGLTVGQ